MRVHAKSYENLSKFIINKRGKFFLPPRMLWNTSFAESCGVRVCTSKRFGVCAFVRDCASAFITPMKQFKFNENENYNYEYDLWSTSSTITKTILHSIAQNGVACNTEDWPAAYNENPFLWMFTQKLFHLMCVCVCAQEKEQERTTTWIDNFVCLGLVTNDTRKPTFIGIVGLGNAKEVEEYVRNCC